MWGRGAWGYFVWGEAFEIEGRDLVDDASFRALLKNTDDKVVSQLNTSRPTAEVEIIVSYRAKVEI